MAKEISHPKELGGLSPYLAEAVGTFVLVFGGVGTAVLAGPKVGPTGVAAAFGLSLLAMVYAIGPISGCHVNPAVTIGLWLAGKFDGHKIPGYLLGQLSGAIVGAGLVLLIAQGGADGYSAAAGGLGANGYAAHSPGGYATGAALLAEAALTGVFVFTVLGATDARAPVGFAGLAIGLALTLVHLIGIPITNTSVNPARSVGPAVFVGGWAMEQLWLFIVAPLLGAAAAAGLYRTLSGARTRIAAVHAERALDSELAARKRLAEPGNPRNQPAE